MNSLFNAQVEYAIKLEELIANEFSSNHIILSELREPREGNYGMVLDKLEWYWDIKIAPILNGFFAIVLGLLSIVIVISECLLGFMDAYDEIVYKIFKTLLTGTYAQAMVMIHALPLGMHIIIAGISLLLYLLWHIQLPSLRILWSLSSSYRSI